MTDPRIEAAARALYEYNTGLTWPKDADDETMAEYYEDARIALAAADVATWRPIESAPKDTDILTHYEDGRVMADRFPYRGMLEWQEQFDKPPTHWQPFPKPPEAP